jgi:hypothetical protein
MDSSMNKYLIIFSILFLVSPAAKAEESWFDSALSLFGFGEEESAPAAPEEPAATKQTMDAVKEALPTSMPKMTDLTSMITDQLGVSKQTAQGGLGTLMGLAKTSLASADFDTLTGYVPEMDTLLKAAPAISENAKGLTSLMGNAGKYANALQGATEAYSQFQSLGISTEQIPQYIDVTSEFLNSKGGKDAADLFEDSVKSVLSAE